MDNIKFDDELVNIDKVKSLIIDMLNKSERIPYVDFKFDSIVTNDKFFEATLMSNNDDDWDEWFEYY